MPPPRTRVPDPTKFFDDIDIGPDISAPAVETDFAQITTERQVVRPPTKLPPGVLRLVRAVAARHELDPGYLFVEATDREITDCRGEIMFRLRAADPPVPMKYIMRWFGKSRSAVVTAVNSHKRLRHLAARGAFL